MIPPPSGFDFIDMFRSGLLQEMRKAGVSPDENTFSHAISACKKGGSRAAAAVLAGGRSGEWPDNSMTFNAAISKARMVLFASSPHLFTPVDSETGKTQKRHSLFCV